MDIIIRVLKSGEELPYDLLLLADPDRPLVTDYCARGRVAVAEMDGKTVGVYVLIDTRPATLELVNIAIDESVQNMGLGKKLIAHAVSQAKDAGAKVLEVGTGNSSISQMHFYQRAGFRIVGVDLDFFTLHYSEEIIENNIVCRDMIRMKMDL